MKYALRTITPAAELPVSLAEAKGHLRVTTADEDALITRLITAGTEMAEDLADAAFVQRTLEASWDAFPCGRELEIPRPPLLAVTSLKYLDADGAEQTVSAGDYIVDAASEPGRVVLKSSRAWPVPGEYPSAVRVRYTAGFGAALAVPARAKQAVLLLAGHWFENRQEVITGTIATTVETAAKALLRQLWHGRL